MTDRAGHFLASLLIAQVTGVVCALASTSVRAGLSVAGLLTLVSMLAVVTIRPNVPGGSR